MIHEHGDINGMLAPPFFELFSVALSLFGQMNHNVKKLDRSVGILNFDTNLWMQTGHFPFIYCIEAAVYERKFTQWETCFEKLGLNSKPIYDCYSSGLGKEVSELLN